MRKQIIWGLMALLIGAVPSLAQDQATEMTSCTPEDTAVVNETIAPLLKTFQEIGAGVDANDPASGITAVIGYDALATNYWTTVYPELPNCLEADALGYSFGIAFDESLINVGLSQLARYEAENGDPEQAQALSELVKTRAAWYSDIVSKTFGQISETGELPDSMFSYELDACTPEESQSEAVTAFTDSVDKYNEMTQSVGEATGENATAVLFGFADLGTTYWIKIYPELPACAEISRDGYNIGLLYNEQIIVMMLQRLAAYETDYGTPETAQSLTDGAAARGELAQSFIEAAFPNAEAEATAEAN